MKKQILCFVSIFITATIIVSCAKKNEQDFQSGTSACDTTNRTYAAHVRPILQASCTSCHSNVVMNAGVNLDTYAGVRAVANNGWLIGTITHANGFPSMPQNAPKLLDCKINTIRAWINRGALNN
jgi:uncharacterized membrane protein